MTNLLKSFASVPVPVTSLSVKVDVPAVYVKLELPPLSVRHPLFEYRSAEIVYKKASFLATSTTKTVPLEAYLKNRENTTVTVNDLAEGSSYQMKVRLMNANGMGAWSRVVEFKVEDDSSDEESEEEKQARKAKKQEKEKSWKTTQDKDTEAKTSGEKKRKKRSKQEAEKRKEEESEQSSEEEVKQASKEVKQGSEATVEQSNTATTEQSGAKPESDQTQESAPKPEANASEPQPLTSESLRHLISSGDAEALEKVEAPVLTEFVSPEGLPALHLCLLECHDMRRVQATLKCLLNKGCSLQQEAACVSVAFWLHF